MSTRSTVKFYSEFEQEEPLLSVYQQCDGYIGGIGHSLAKWLKGKTLINGIGNQTMEKGFANGMGCLAAQYVADNKTCIGSFYTTTNSNKQEYNYEVRFINGQLIIQVGSFKGTPEELLNYNEEEE